MLQVKFDGQIEVATMTGKASKLAVIDRNGNRYALLQNSKTGALSAWSGDTNENSTPCQLVDDLDAATDARVDADAAEYEFRLFCTDGPGAKADDVLASMNVEREHSKRYWKRAIACARMARAAWLAA